MCAGGPGPRVLPAEGGYWTGVCGGAGGGSVRVWQGRGPKRLGCACR